VLTGDATLEQVRIAVATPRLDIYPCLRGHPKAHEMLLAPSFEAMVRDLTDRYDVVVFDSPPTLLVPDSTIIMEHVDCFAPVARAGMTRSRNFRKMLETLPRRRMLGAILDEGTRKSRKGYYDHYAVDPVPDARGDLEAPAAASAEPDEERAHGG
jgi:Mrp family chromosome partitioning ATPase